MELSELVDLLSKAEDRNVPVFIDNKPPATLCSYRGYYNECAITCDPEKNYPDVPTLDDPGKPFEMNMAGYGTYTPGHTELTLPENPTVDHLIKAIEMTYYEAFEGYKGGQYEFGPDTRVWQSEYGTASGLQIHKVEYLPDRVDLLTVEDRGW